MHRARSLLDAYSGGCERAVPGDHGAWLLLANRVAVVRLGPHQQEKADHQGSTLRPQPRLPL